MSLPTSPPSNSSAQEIRVRLRELLRERMGSTGSWYPLSHGQEALWFLWKLAPQSCAYNLVLPVGIVGDLDVDAFDRSLQKLSERHACLRTEFREEEGQPRQRPMPPPHQQQHRLNIELVEASGWSAAQLDDAMRERARRPFDLEAGAALRVTLFRRSPVAHTLLIVIHHILADLWSLIILMDELRDVYMAEKDASAAVELSPLPLRYEDYVRWQRRMLDGEAGERLWEYWRGELAGELPALDLPTDHTRPSVQSFRGATITRRLDAGLSRQLRLLAGTEESTLFMTLLAAYEVLLYRHTGQEKMFVGTPVSGRSRAELNGVFGDFVNIVPLRVDLSADITFRQLLGQVRRRVLGAISHQDYPFSLMVDRLEPTRDLSRSPIFQTSFVLQKFHRFEEFSRAILPGEDEPLIPFGDLTLEPLPFAQQDGQFDLNLEMKEDEGGRLVAAWKYSADLFEADTVARMAAQFETLLGEIVADPGRRISELRLLTAEESARARASGEGERIGLPAASSVYELFRSQVERSANAVAVACGDDSLTYSELRERVDGFAQGLAELGVGTEVLVAVFLPRGLDFVATLLAVSKAGGAFLPLDPRHPLSRTAQILESSRAPFVLTSRDGREHAARALADLPEASRPRVVCVEELARGQAGASLPPVAERSLAYVLFTSGSTGRPKGVMVEHRGMVNHTLAKLSDLGIGAGDTLAQNGPQSFDIVVWQCLAPLAVGGRVAVFTDEVAEDPALLVDEVQERAVTVLQLVPSMLHAVLEHVTAHAAERRKLAGLRYVVPTGDALPTELCRKWLELYPDIPLLNTYGSTECSDDQCHYRLDSLGPADEAVAVASIGTPIHNLTAHVLDGNLTPVPAGVVGELYIGGVGVGRGYLNDPARTAAAFAPDPFADAPGARMYRTRDLARRRADGNLNFLGRLDHMIKLRGFRIEPKEIEAALCQHPSVSEAAVLARSHPSGERRIVGYVVASRGRVGEEGAAAAGGDGVPGVEELRRHLADSLPHYMIPAAFRFVDSLPLNSNGKLDSSQLPDPEWQAISAGQFVAPRTAAEEKMERIWAEVLGREGVSVTENFFEVGGDSIRSIQIVARCKQAGMHVTPGDIFLHPTVAALTTLAEKNAGENSGTIPDLAGEAEAEATGGSPSATALYVSREHLELALGQVVLDEE